MKSGFLKKLDERSDIVVLLLLVITLIPLFFISFYNQPSTDDYGCTTVVLEKGFWGAQKYYYFNWSGRYFATAMASINPLVYHSFTGYKIVSIMLIAFFVMAVYWVITLVFPKMNSLSRWGIISLVVYAYFLHLPEMAQGLFWMSGSLTYQTAAIFIILFAGCIIKFLQSGKIIFYILSILTSFAVIGTNEVSMVYTVIIALLILAGNYFLNKKVSYHLLSLTILTILFSAFVITAPGNSVRGGHFPLEHEFLPSVKNTFDLGKAFLWTWVRESFFLFSFLFFFFFAKTDDNGLSKVLLRPAPLYLFLLCISIPFIGIFPGFWSMGVTPPLRTMNVPYFYFLIGIVYFLYSLACYLKQRLNFNPNAVPAGFRSALLVIVIVLSIIKPNNLKVVFDDIFSGRITSYSEQMEQRREFIYSFNGDICKIKPLRDVPNSLYFQDIASDTADWKNEIFDKYYGKNCILVK